MSANPSRWESSAPIRYPDPDIVVLDPRFRASCWAMPRSSASPPASASPRGRSGSATGATCCSRDIPERRAAALGREHRRGQPRCASRRSHPDGNTRDRQGRLITCELGSRTLTRTEHDGTVTVLADAFDGKRLTGPNDVVVKSDGSIWFSDNGAGIRGNYLGDKAPKELPYRVYRLDPASGALTHRGRRHGAAERARASRPTRPRLYVVDTPDGTRRRRMSTTSVDGTRR